MPFKQGVQIKLAIILLRHKALVLILVYFIDLWCLLYQISLSGLGYFYLCLKKIVLFILLNYPNTSPLSSLFDKLSNEFINLIDNAISNLLSFELWIDNYEILALHLYANMLFMFSVTMRFLLLQRGICDFHKKMCLFRLYKQKKVERFCEISI